MNTDKASILIVEDDSLTRDMVRYILESAGFHILAADDGSTGLEAFDAHPEIDLVVTDILMPQIDGIRLLKKIRQRDSEMPVIIMTGASDVTYAIDALKLGANDYLLKDENIEATILLSVDKALEKKKLLDQNQRLMADLARTNQELKRLTEVQGSYLPTFVIDDSHTITHWNTACKKLTALSARKMIGTKNQWQALYSEKRPLMADLIIDGMPEESVNRYFRGKLQKSLIVEGAYEAEEFFPGLGDGGRWIFSIAAPLRDAEGRILGAMETLQDITLRKQAQEAVQQSEERYRSLLETSPDPIVNYDLEGRVTYLNPAFTRVFGWSLEELLGRKVDFVPETELARTRRAIRETMEQGYCFGYEAPRVTKDREIINVSINAAACRDKEGKTVGLVVNLRDITEKKKAEQALQRLRNYLQSIVDSMPSVLVGVDMEGRVTQWNRGAEKATGVSADKAQGRSLTDVFPRLTGEMAKVRQAIKENQPQKETKVVSEEDGETRFSDITVYPLIFNGVEGAVIRKDDVTERVRIEEMMIQSEKMVSVGGLAAGMAHEINNPLAGIIQSVQVIRNRLFADLPKNENTARECGTTMGVIKDYMENRGISSLMDTVIASGRRAAQIVENMLSFARKDESADLAVSTHSLPDLLDHTVELAETDYDLKKKYDFRQIKIVREYAPDLPPIPCQASKIQQVLLNILNNGSHAMFEKKGEKEPCFILRTIKEKSMARIEIEDNGPGIGESVRRRIFEPFFTTKKPGVGTGLGLSVSYFIITKNHNGTMSVESTPGKGTKLIIRLPFA